MTNVNLEYVKKVEEQNEKLKQQLQKVVENKNKMFFELLISLQILNDLYDKFVCIARNDIDDVFASHNIEPLEDSVLDISICVEQQKIWSILDFYFDETETDVFNILDVSVDYKSDAVFEYPIVKNTLIRIWKGFSIPTLKSHKPAKKVLVALNDVLGKDNVKKLERMACDSKNSLIEYDSTVHLPFEG
jgi:hypothetical protein